MNIFRLAGDMCHLLSFYLLVSKLRSWRNARGISLKTQELLLLTFVCRYLDLFTTFISVYNSLMKITFIAVTAYIVWMIRTQNPWKNTYDSHIDNFNHLLFSVAPCAVFSLIFVAEWSFFEIIWTFSIYLESVAILPQLLVLHRYAALEEYADIEKITSDYVFALGAYRFLYIFNWIYRAFTETHYNTHWAVWIAGVVQTALFADFAYYYVISKLNGEKMSIPTSSSK